MALTVKEKELVNIGASVATGCKPCTDYHFKKVRKAGAQDDEIKQAISFAVLGLFTSYRIVQGHQGRIEVESEVGKGSRFVVTLPKQACAGSPDPQETAEAAPGHRCERLDS
jgi:AhpD family alkylhydroperoxidase